MKMTKQSDEMKSDGDGVGRTIHLDRLAHEGTSVEMTFERRREQQEKGSRARRGCVWPVYKTER